MCFTHTKNGRNTDNIMKSSQNEQQLTKALCDIPYSSPFLLLINEYHCLFDREV